MFSTAISSPLSNFDQILIYLIVKIGMRLSRKAEHKPLFNPNLTFTTWRELDVCSS